MSDMVEIQRTRNHYVDMLTVYTERVSECGSANFQQALHIELYYTRKRWVVHGQKCRGQI